MKLQIVFVAFLVSFCSVHGQDVVEPDSLLQCYVGSTVDGVENVTLVDCAPSEDTCQTKIEIRDGKEVVWKECKSADACKNNEASNEVGCFSDEAEEKGLRVCYSCCTTDGCNVGSDIPTEGPDEE